VGLALGSHERLAAAGALAFPGLWLKPAARSSLPIADMGGGAFGVIAILAALHEGKGAYLDLSLFETAFFWASMRHGLDPAAARALMIDNPARVFFAAA
jgi:crotonobetainyl-CoA:carnitine CoA-transferase CaiB-like acyl-CoA transferase